MEIYVAMEEPRTRIVGLSSGHQSVSTSCGLRRIDATYLEPDRNIIVRVGADADRVTARRVHVVRHLLPSTADDAEGMLTMTM